MSTFDTSKLIAESSASPVTDTYTIWATANIVVFHITIDWWPRTWWAPTFNGVELIQAGTAQSSGGEGYAEIWYMLDPPTWIQNVSIPNTWTENIQVAISSYISSTGAFAFDVVAQTSATSTNPTVSIIPTTTTGFIVDSLFTGYRKATTGNNRQILYNNDTGNEGNACQYYLNPPASSVAMSYTQASDDWGIIAGAFKEVVSAVQNIKLWSNTINKMYLWSTEVLKAYLWSTIVYDKT